jgi:predicted PurR-regulated permease PerM
MSSNNSGFSNNYQSHNPHSLPMIIALCFIFFLLLLVVFYSWLGISFFSSFVLAYFIALLLLYINYPIQTITGGEDEIALTIYALIVFFFITVLIIYILFHAITDCRKDGSGYLLKRMCKDGECKL